MESRKEWRRVSRSANGALVVTVTLAEENLTARWSVKTYIGQIKPAVIEARSYASKMLTELAEVA